MQYDIFLAHASSDKPSAIELYDALQPDVATFLDCRSLAPGDDWTIAIPAAQEAARATVVLISRHADKAFYLRDEIATAISRYRSRGEEHRVIPVYLDGFPKEPGAIPYGLHILNGIDLVAEGGIKGVAKRLRQLLAGGGPHATSRAPVGTLATTAHRFTEVERRALYERVAAFNTAQFDEFVFYVGLPERFIRARGAAPAERAIDAVQLIDGNDPEQCRLALEAADRAEGKGAVARGAVARPKGGGGTKGGGAAGRGKSNGGSGGANVKVGDVTIGDVHGSTIVIGSGNNVTGQVGGKRRR